MRLLITGPAGFVGGYVVKEALDRGHDVIALVHKSGLPENVANPEKLESFRFELGSNDDLDLKAYDLDAVIHLAGALSQNREQSRRVVVEGSRQLTEAALRASIGKMVLVGSLAAIDYATISAMSTVDETAPVIAGSASADTYAVLKAEQEAVVQHFYEGNHNLLVILRPGLVYDSARLSTAHAGIVRGSFGLLVSHDGQVPLVGARNLAGAIVDAVELEASGREVLHLVDDFPPSQDDYIRYLKIHRHIGAVSVTIPWKLYAVIGTFCRASLTMLGCRSRVPEMFTRAGFAARLKPFKFSNAQAKLRLSRSFVREI